MSRYRSTETPIDRHREDTHRAGLGRRRRERDCKRFDRHEVILKYIERTILQ